MIGLSGKRKRTGASPTKKATLADVARLAGVGPMTVSRTINGHPYVSDVTANRVRAAIRKLNYRPNLAARVLTGQSSRSIGLIVPDLSDTFFSTIAHAVQEVARDSGYLVWLAVSDEDASIEAAQAEMMAHQPVDGIVLVPADSKHKYLKQLATGSLPVVTVDRPMEVASTDTVGVENRSGARLAVDHLIQHGNRRIICAASNSHLLTIKERIVGYQEAMRNARLRCEPEVHLSSLTSAREAMSRSFASRTPPEALFTANNVSTTWIIETLREMKIEIGKDIALVGFDDVEFYSLLTPSITAVTQPIAELGRMSARLLMQRIKGELTGSSIRTVIPVSLIIRESCGCNKKTIQRV